MSVNKNQLAFKNTRYIKKKFFLEKYFQCVITELTLSAFKAGMPKSKQQKKKKRKGKWKKREKFLKKKKGAREFFFFFLLRRKFNFPLQSTENVFCE